MKFGRNSTTEKSVELASWLTSHELVLIGRSGGRNGDRNQSEEHKWLGHY